MVRCAGRREQQRAPRWQIEPPEMFRMTLVLHVVKHRHLAAANGHWSREARVEEDIQPLACDRYGQPELLPQDSCWPIDRGHRLYAALEWWQHACFTIGEYHPVVDMIDECHRLQQAA